MKVVKKKEEPEEEIKNQQEFNQDDGWANDEPNIEIDEPLKEPEDAWGDDLNLDDEFLKTTQI